MRTVRIAESDRAYFQRRATEEESAAAAALDIAARAAHRELAGRYAQLAAAIGEVEEKLGGEASSIGISAGALTAR